MAKKERGQDTTRSDADRRVRQADRLARVMRILSLIQGNARWNAAALAAELDCTERTVRRYLNVLELAGVPFSYDRSAGCYQVLPSFRFPVLNLNEDELIGQAIATAVTKAPGLGAAGSSEPTTRKLSAVSSPQAQQVLNDVGQLVEVLDLKLVDHARHREIIGTIQHALLKGRQLAGRYESPYLARPARLTLHPYRLCLVRQAWYLIGCEVSGAEPKTYRVGRFQTLRIREADALVPDGFRLDEYFGNAWAVFRGNEAYDVELRFSSDAAMQVTETKWHRTQQVQRHRDGSLTLTFRVDGLDEILWWLLGWTGFVQVVKPVELRDRLVKQLTDGIAMQ